MKIEDKELELALEAVRKQYGAGAIISDGSFKDRDVEVFSTRNIELDDALGVGGLPRGRICEIYGAEALGKSLIALNLTAECQRQGGTVLYVDAEHDLDPAWGRQIGVDFDDMLLSQPDYGEQALDIVVSLIQTGSVDLVIVDSVAALIPLEELEGSMDDKQVGAQARLMSKGIRKIRGLANKTGTCVVFLNQIRDKIGFMQQGTTTPGGRALKFFSSVRIELIRTGDYKESGETAGTKIKAKIVKNKVATPHRVASYNIVDGHGFDNYSALVDKAAKNKLLLRAGSWVYYPEVDKETGEITKGKPVGNGASQIREYFSTNQEEYISLMEQVRAAEKSED